jgi:hypothetical protein
MRHELKTWPVGFVAILSGEKTHEIRPADRDYQVGDTLHLREFVPHEPCKGSGEIAEAQLHQAHYLVQPCTCQPPRGVYTGRECEVTVGYVTRPGSFGLPSNLVVMSVQRTKETT